MTVLIQGSDTGRHHLDIPESFLVEKTGELSAHPPVAGIAAVRPYPVAIVKVPAFRVIIVGPVIHVLGADLMDGTPIYDIKPYVRYADSRPDARSGFTDQVDWEPLTVEFSPETDSACDLRKEDLEILRDILAQDPRPAFHDDPEKIYGMAFAGHDIRFRVSGHCLTVIEIRPL